MAVTVVLEGAAPDRCAVRLSPIAELTACLHALGDVDHHPDSRAWVTRAERDLDPDVRAEAAGWAPLWGALRARFLFPMDPGGERELAAELGAVEALPVPAFVGMCAEAILDRERVVTYDRVATEPAARRAFLDRATRLSPGRGALAGRLLDDPATLRAELTAFLASFARRTFAAEWRAGLRTLREDAARRARELERHGLGVLARLSPTAAEHVHPHRVVFDKLYDGLARLTDQACLLVPSVHARPHLIVKHNPGLPVVVQYAVGAVDEVSFDVVHNRMTVLQDLGRIRICRLILRRPHTTKELAAKMNMSEPQVSRHLRRLREAGLVTSRRDGRLVHYALETAAVRRIGDDLIGALRR